jgi:IclR family transcriptional regulator, KDG regulon repressor
MTGSDTKPIQSLERGLIALELAVRGMGKPAELAKILKVDRSTAYRLLYTLKLRGYLDQDLLTREFVPNTAKFFVLSSEVAGLISWPTVAASFLMTLRDRTGETANLGVLQEAEVVYVGQQQTQEAVIVNHSLGTRRPLHCSALGKAILAFLPEAQVDCLIAEHGLAVRTHRTIANPQILKLHLNSIREQGYAVDDEETLHGVRCVAAPIYDHREQVIAAIGISGPSTRVTQDKIPTLGSIVVDVAAQASAALGAHPPALQTNGASG